MTVCFIIKWLFKLHTGIFFFPLYSLLGLIVLITWYCWLCRCLYSLSFTLYVGVLESQNYVDVRQFESLCLIYFWNKAKQTSNISFYASFLAVTMGLGISPQGIVALSPTCIVTLGKILKSSFLICKMEITVPLIPLFTDSIHIHCFINSKFQ